EFVARFKPFVDEEGNAKSGAGGVGADFQFRNLQRIAEAGIAIADQSVEAAAATATQRLADVNVRRQKAAGGVDINGTPDQTRKSNLQGAGLAEAGIGGILEDKRPGQDGNPIGLGRKMGNLGPQVNEVGFDTGGVGIVKPAARSKAEAGTDA